MDENQYAASLFIENKKSIPWPPGVPLPVVGDLVLIEHDGETYSLKVESRLFAVVPDEDGEMKALITIRAISQPVARPGRASVHPLKI
ncbi:hypothetical protein [Janthinobacterium sp. LB2P10]|uniref:hypothetical protein n=1 Tax=Janthinobacterium sp. LB2P10 TaxID=3424194 RepID=UPI003F24C0E1